MFGVMIDAVVWGDSAAASDTPQFKPNGPELGERGVHPVQNRGYSSRSAADLNAQTVAARASWRRL
jgi:hypothetical protein